MIKSVLMFSLIFLINISNVISANYNNNEKCEQSNEEECVLIHKLFAHNDISNELDWNKIKLVELEEEVNLDFETKNYLPEHFNPLKGKYDLDWNSIKLVEMDEEVSLDFDTKDYLPQGFNPYRVMCASQGIL